MSFDDREKSFQLLRAAHDGDVASVRSLLGQGLKADTTVSNGWTPLMEAAREGKAEVVEVLLGAGADVNARDNDGRFPLLEAASQGHAGVVKLLLAAGAELHMKFGNGLSALSYAALKGSVETLEALLDAGADANERTPYGMTPLIEAASAGEFDAVTFLLEKGAQVEARTNQGETALFFAAANGHSRVISALWAYDVNTNSQTDDGVTPLFMAARNGHLETVNDLLARRADVNLATKGGTTPLMVAAGNYHFDVVKRLVEAGADRNARAADGYAALSAAAEGHQRMVRLLTDPQREDVLYRFMSFTQFVDLVSGRRMYLSQVTRWDDTHEAHTMRKILKEGIRSSTPGMPERLIDAVERFMHKSMYAQCWTSLDESDALWRIYSQDHMGIRIAVNRDRVLEAISRAIPQVRHGKVHYCSADDAVRKVLTGAVTTDPDGPLRVNLVDCCLYKREQFKHEEEYRFCAQITPPGPYPQLPVDDDDPATNDRIVAIYDGYVHPPLQYYEFDPSLIESVTLDPRAPEWFVETIRNLCSGIPGMGSVVVEKSSLYGQPAV